MTATHPGLLHDCALPGLGLLMDDVRLRTWLDERGQHLLQRRYVRYKEGTSCVVGLRLESGWAFALATSSAAHAKLDKLRESSPEQLLADDDEQRVLLVTVWGDRDLPALGALPRAVSRLLPPLGPHRISTLVHKPFRRWVGRLEAVDPSSQALLRAYRKGAAADAAQRLRLARQARGAVQVPRLLGRSSRWSALAVEYLPGRPLHAPSATGGLAKDEVAETGRTLARVHRAVPAGPPVTRQANPAATVDLVGAILPHLRSRTRDLLAALVARRPGQVERALCHGDFSLDQVIVTPAGRLGFVDWDRGGAGAPAADLASAVAAGLDAATVAQLYAGYAEVRPLPQDLDWHLAQAKLLRLAEPFRNASPGWSAEVEARVEELEASWA